MSEPVKLPIVVIACRVLQSSLAQLLPEQMSRNVKFMDYGLHRVPMKLTDALQEALDDVSEPSLVILGYGLCGNGLRGLRAGQHTLLVPRTDDCIAILLGSYKAYVREFSAVPGTYYLTKGWLESGSNPLQEYHEYSARYKHADVMWILDQQYQHYERLALVASDPVEMALYRDQAQAVAHFCQRWGMRYEEILGSDDYVRRLIDAAGALSQNGRALPTGLAADLVLIPPGGEIRQEMFMR
ncbi:MAG: hypothetical protein AUK03_10690 [Anaerolineae bacterium CG2_30_64_16]|nr:MAG: hypothetical protein AUK03_10690 [Anaerolineae bacterium CG2_30_64_16]